MATLFNSGASALHRKKFTPENALMLSSTIRRQHDEMFAAIRASGDGGDEDHPPAAAYVDTTVLVEALREFVEVIVWGDKHDESVFFVFLEQNVMSTLEALAVSDDTPSEVKVQVIQCVTILLQNLTNAQSIYSVCSNNHINRMIQLKFDPEDEELQSNYVSFLKTLCLRLNASSVQFFFQQKRRATVPGSSDTTPAATPSPNTSPRTTAGEPMDQVFPLFAQAVKLLGSEEHLVRTAARQIVITVLQLQDPSVVAYMQLVMPDVFGIIATWICAQVDWVDQRIRLRAQLLPAEKPQTQVQWASLAVLDNRIEDLIDDLYYLNDVFDVPHDFVAPLLLGMLHTQVIETCLIQPIDAALLATPTASSPPSVGHDASVSGGATATPALALLILSHWIKVNTVEPLHTILVRACIGVDPSVDGAAVLDDDASDGDDVDDASDGNGGALLATSRVARVLSTPNLVQSHPAALAVVQSILGNKLTSDALRQSLLGTGWDAPSRRCAAAAPPTTTGAGDSPPSPVKGGGTSSPSSTPNGATPSPPRYDWASLRATFGEYQLSLQRGASYQLSANGASYAFPEEVASRPLVRACAASLTLQASSAELLRLNGFQFTVAMFLSMTRGMATTTVQNVICRATVLAQHALLQRVETYRQHLWMLYGASGENSVLTPSSLLCQLMRKDSDREIADPLEVLFARIERDMASIVESYAPQILREDVWGAVKLGRDVALACPLTPPLSCWKPQLAPLLQGDIRLAERCVNAYLDAQQRANAHVPIHRRTPQDEDEVEYLEAAAWLLLRHVLFVHLVGLPADPLRAATHQFACKRGVRDEVRAWQLAETLRAPGVRCEYTPEGSDTAFPCSTVAPGTVLYLFVDGSDVFFVEPGKDARANDGVVVQSLRALYCEALVHSKQLFRLSVLQEAPLSRSRVSVVLRDRTVCQRVSQAIQAAAATLKHNAAALLWRVLLDDPLRDTLNIFVASDE